MYKHNVILCCMGFKYKNYTIRVLKLDKTGTYQPTIHELPVDIKKEGYENINLNKDFETEQEAIEYAKNYIDSIVK